MRVAYHRFRKLSLRRILRLAPDSIRTLGLQLFLLNIWLHLWRKE